MNTKLRKLAKLAAAGLFLVALVINVKVTLDDPFVMLSEQAIATGTGSGGGSGTASGSGGIYETKQTIVIETTETKIIDGKSCARSRTVTTVKCLGEGNLQCEFNVGATPWSEYSCP
ncbi:hypothetical protein [Arenibacter lacus]|uniref:hypothetical protein n=2 Tax=Arenibacter TaxID=178469 RepID=UPI00123D92BE|nr:hypothetical protein [Arenibacter lacus]